MLKKIKKFTLFINIAVLICACGQKKTTVEFDNLYLLYATPSESTYLPLRMFSENDSLFVQYVKNGKPLDKIQLAFNRLLKGENNDTLYCFDEIINGQKQGSYQIPKIVFDTMSHLVWDRLTYENKEKLTTYSVEWSLSKKQYSPVVAEDDYLNEWYSYTTYEKPVLDAVYAIHSNPQSIEKRSFDEIEKDNIWTSKDGNLRIYYQCFYLGGNGWGSDYPLEIVQFKDGNNVSAFGKIDWGYEELHLENFIYTNSIKIYTVILNNKTCYLVDRAMFDGMPMSATNVGYYSDGDVLQIYAIENGELVKKKLFNTTKKVVDNLAIEYDGNQEGTNLFKYDDNKKVIYVPLVDGIKLTNKYLLYQWDGKYFTYKGIE